MPDVAPASGLIPHQDWPRFVTLPRYDSDGKPIGSCAINPHHVLTIEPTEKRAQDGAPLTLVWLAGGFSRFVRGAFGDVSAALSGRNV